MPDRSISDFKKKLIIEKIIEKLGSIIIRNEQYDCEQIIIHNGRLLLDYYSPRENLTYSQDSISIEQAWIHVTALHPELVRQLLDVADGNEQADKGN